MPSDPPESAQAGPPPRRAVVTGGAGFIGRSLITRLSAEGWDAVGIDVRPGPRVVTGDCTRPGSWTEVLQGADLVVHAAALLGDGSSAADLRAVNVGGARVVAQAALDARVGRMVHLSSTAVLGEDFPDGADETQPIQMTGNPLTDSLVAAEHQVLTVAARGLPLTVLRPAEVYGPHSTQWTVRVVQLIQKGLFVLVDGGAGVLSPIFVDDAVAGIMAAARHDAGRGEIFHLTGGHGVPAAEFFGRYAGMTGRTLRSLPRAAASSLTTGAERLMRPMGLAPPFSTRSMESVTRPGTYDIGKARRLLDWTPQVPLDEGMARTEVWLRDVGLLGRPGA